MGRRNFLTRRLRHLTRGQMANAFADHDAVMTGWREFKANNADALRNRLTEHYLYLVRYNAERIGAKLPDEVDVEDLMSAGVFGLLDAIDAFDLARGVKFETYCAPRIRGAILDELRTMDWVPRLVRHRAHKLDDVTRSLEMELGRLPTDDEIARRLGMSKPQFARLMRDATSVSLISLSRRHYDSDSQRDVLEVDLLQDERQADPTNDAQRNDLREMVIRGLNRAERLIIILYYYEQMTMKEIGMTLDLSESRVSQMHSAILARLKAQLESRRKEFATECLG